MNEISDSRVFSNFCSIKDADEVTDGDTIGLFRNIPVENNLQERLFTQVLLMLEEKEFIFNKVTIFDSTIIALPIKVQFQYRKLDIRLAKATC